MKLLIKFQMQTDITHLKQRKAKLERRMISEIKSRLSNYYEVAFSQLALQDDKSRNIIILINTEERK